jgi:hypothetical protein
MLTSEKDMTDLVTRPTAPYLTEPATDIGVYRMNGGEQSVGILTISNKRDEDMGRKRRRVLGY